MLKTVDEIVAAFGGTGKAAKILGVDDPVISNWKARNKIPAKFYFVFCGLLAQHGQAQPEPILFGMLAARTAKQKRSKG